MAIASQVLPVPAGPRPNVSSLVRMVSRKVACPKVRGNTGARPGATSIRMPIRRSTSAPIPSA